MERQHRHILCVSETSNILISTLSLLLAITYKVDMLWFYCSELNIFLIDFWFNWQ
jgi:hypothetical protein